MSPVKRSAVTGYRRGGVLDRLAGRRPGRDDRGAVAITVAILLGGGVLLGLAALVIDVGQLYAERTQLQSAADAAALGVARSCAADTADCRTNDDIWNTAERYANLNARDGLTNVITICGRAPGRLDACEPESATNLTACLGTPPAADYVEIRVGTEVAGDRYVLPPTFAQTMTGWENYEGTEVGACARAAWGPQDMTIIAMTISEAEFDDATDNGTDYEREPPYPPNPDRGDDYTIEFWRGAHGLSTDPAPAGWDPAGPAGFVEGGASTCSIGLPAGGEIDGRFIDFDDWQLAPAACETLVRNSRANNRIIYIPIHDGRRGLTTDPQYRVTEVAPFVVTGFQFGAPLDNTNGPLPHYRADDHRQKSDLNDVHPCDVIRHRCVSGVFVGAPIPIADLVADSFVRLVG